METENYNVDDGELVGKVSIPLKGEEVLERMVIGLSKRYNVPKAEMSRILLREGGAVVEKRKRLVILPAG